MKYKNTTTTASPMELESKPLYSSPFSKSRFNNNDIHAQLDRQIDRFERYRHHYWVILNMIILSLLLIYSCFSTSFAFPSFSSLSLSNNSTSNLCLIKPTQQPLLQSECFVDISSIWYCDTRNNKTWTCEAQHYPSLFEINGNTPLFTGMKCSSHSDCKNELDRCISNEVCSWLILVLEDAVVCKFAGFKFERITMCNGSVWYYLRMQRYLFMINIDCNSNCLTCAGPDDCTSCRDLSLLSLNSRKCVTECA